MLTDHYHCKNGFLNSCLMNDSSTFLCSSSCNSNKRGSWTDDFTHQQSTEALFVFCSSNCTSRFRRFPSSIWIKVSESVKSADKRFIWSENVPTLGSWWHMIENCWSKQVDFMFKKWFSLQHNIPELTEADFTVVYTYKSSREEITTKTAAAGAAVFHWEKNLHAYL